MNKIRVGVIFGGRSSEHEISLRSAKSVIDNLDKDKFDVVLVGLDRAGRFHFEQSQLLQNLSTTMGEITASEAGQTTHEITPANINLPTPDATEHHSKPIDVAFPVLHGPYGEDGAFQGLLKSLNIPFVGPDVLGSAACMDKDVAKRLLQSAGIPCARGITVRHADKDTLDYDAITADLGSTLFIKPACQGSSVGVSKACNKDGFGNAIEDAFQYDNKIIIEEGIKGREIECAVLGNEQPKASVLGEIIVEDGFYSYDAKYISEDAAKLCIPADLPAEVSDKVRETAVDAFKALCCEGMARVDFFVTDDGEAYVNELNTIPGFTSISMYPKLWEATGLSYGALLEELIRLAIARHERDAQLRTCVKG